MSKTAAVIQKPEKTPNDFYERPYEAFQVYTPFSPQAPENQQMAIQHLWSSHTLTLGGNFRNLKASLE
jgi:hypothetical protein